MKTVVTMLACSLLSLVAPWAGAPSSAVMVLSTADTPRTGARLFRLQADGGIVPIEIRADDFGGGLTYGMRRPVVSPDRSKIAYTVEGELWIHDLDYNSTLPVTDVAVPAEGPWKSVFVTIKHWSPDSRRLIYRIGYDEFEMGCEADVSTPTKVREAPYGFYVHELDKLESRRLHEGERLADYLLVEHLAWLADGSFVVATSAPAGTTVPPAAAARIDSSSQPDRGGNLFRISADGSDFSYLGSLGGLPSQAVVSEDGSRLAALVYFKDEEDKRYTQLVEIDLEHGSSRPLAPRNRWNETRQWPRYRPGGREVAYRIDSTLCIDEACKSREVRRNVSVQGEARGDCLEAFDFAWIDAGRMALRCGSTLFVISADSGRTLGSLVFDGD